MTNGVKPMVLTPTMTKPTTPTANGEETTDERLTTATNKCYAGTDL